MTRIQALRAALPNADVQRMAHYSPSLLEVMTQDDPGRIMRCICLLSSMPVDAVVLAASSTICANNRWLIYGQYFRLTARSLWGEGERAGRRGGGGYMGFHACMLVCRDSAAE